MGSSNEMEQVDLIDRQAAIDALTHKWNGMVTSVFDVINSLPSAQPDLDEWCTDCKEYDKERNSCPRWNRVIKETLNDLQEERKTQLSEESTTSDCISRQAAIDEIRKCRFVVDAIERIRGLPSAQREGKWIKDREEWFTDYPYKCTYCGKYSRARYHFCPNCGADMRGEEHGET